MKRPSTNPGPQSMAALQWLAQVGASPIEPLRLVIGCGERVINDHVRRLVAAGLVKRVAMGRDQGSLIVLTRTGALQAGYQASRALRSVAPTTWAHLCACAWTSAWLELRLRTKHRDQPGMGWWGERQIAEDDFWRRNISYRDRRGTVRITHRPDLAVRIASGPIPVEVELQRKVRARLVGILGMYAELSDDEDSPFVGVIYIAGSSDIAENVTRVAADVGLCQPRLSVRSLEGIVQQTRGHAAEWLRLMAKPSAPGPGSEHSASPHAAASDAKTLDVGTNDQQLASSQPT